MKDFLSDRLDKAKTIAREAKVDAKALFDSSANRVSASFSGLSLQGLLLNSDKAIDCDRAAKEFDEKHYFLVPQPTNDNGYGLFILRWLPKDAPPINDLPKRRVMHFPNENSEAQLQSLLMARQKDKVFSVTSEQSNTNLGVLANEVDDIERSVTTGALLVGGLITLINPVVGVGLIVGPKIIGSLAKFGLSSADEKMSQKSLNKQIEDAEAKVAAQFKDSSTVKYVNPVLSMVARCHQSPGFDPISWLDVEEAIARSERDTERYYEGACQAVASLYKDDYRNAKKSIIRRSRPNQLPDNLMSWLSMNAMSSTASDNP